MTMMLMFQIKHDDDDFFVKVLFQLFSSFYMLFIQYKRPTVHSTKIILVVKVQSSFKYFSNMGEQNISKITCSVQEVNNAGGLKPNWGRLISTREELQKNQTYKLTPGSHFSQNVRKQEMRWNENI